VSVRRFELRRLAAIYVGGVLGALARVGLAEAAPHGADQWPWATFAVNMAGALLLGYFVLGLVTGTSYTKREPARSGEPDFVIPRGGEIHATAAD
jgi:fluoride ion exporter CrcB/FEX